ncbi:hypothetical protein HTZ77_29610 [Nonomuraea sp. SMC257]|uniref:Uncharacterized protein n=1 Tax=Nonomuraea montanisoli TaxID=2741721 RepID=A0A7Y6IDD6_9ACTN|nr:hypothetical protein [Nonomuraea montanisoli]NUW35558.1 hypothetical protein [Nonomuraea montanisoli]
MDTEAHLHDLASRVQALEAGALITDVTTTLGIIHVADDVAQLRNEVLQDLAALGDEVAALRRHVAVLSSSIPPRNHAHPGHPHPDQPSDS